MNKIARPFYPASDRLWFLITPLCYTSAHRYETLCISFLFARPQPRWPPSSIRAELEPGRYGHPTGKTSAQCAPVDLRWTECRSLFFRRWQETDLPVVSWRCEVRSDLCDEYRRQRPAHGLDRQGTHHLQFLLSRWQEDSLCLDSSREPGVPSAP